MKSLQSAGVFGLLPVPPVPDTDEHGRGRGPWPAASEEDGAAAPELGPSPSPTQRLVMPEELARLRERIERVNALARLPARSPDSSASQVPVWISSTRIPK